MFGHGIVDCPAGKDDLGVVAKLLRLVDEVVGVDGDAVAADKAGREPDEVPLGRSGIDDGLCVESHLVENNREFVEECNVQIPLHVLDHFRGFGGPDVLCDIDIGNKAVEFGKDVCGLLVHAGDDLGNLVDGVLVVARIDPLGGVSDRKVPATLHPGFTFKDRYHDLLGEAGPDGGFTDDDSALLEVLSDSCGGVDDRSEIRLLVPGDRGGDADDDDVCFADAPGVRGSCKSTLPVFIEFVHGLLVAPVTDCLYVPGKSLGKGKAHVSKTNDADGFSGDLLLNHGIVSCIPVFSE